jgi:hypothetical protein
MKFAGAPAASGMSDDLYGAVARILVREALVAKPCVVFLFVHDFYLYAV